MAKYIAERLKNGHVVERIETDDPRIYSRIGWRIVPNHIENVKDIAVILLSVGVDIDTDYFGDGISLREKLGDVSDDVVNRAKEIRNEEGIADGDIMTIDKINGAVKKIKDKKDKKDKTPAEPPAETPEDPPTETPPNNGKGNSKKT